MTALSIAMGVFGIIVGLTILQSIDIAQHASSRRERRGAIIISVALLVFFFFVVFTVAGEAS